MLAGNPCSLLCFVVFPLLVAIFALHKRRCAMAALCAISILFGVGPLVALLTLFELFKWEWLLDISLLAVGVTILFMVAYVIKHYFLLVGR